MSLFRCPFIYYKLLENIKLGIFIENIRNPNIFIVENDFHDTTEDMHSNIQYIRNTTTIICFFKITNIGLLCAIL